MGTETEGKGRGRCGRQAATQQTGTTQLPRLRCCVKLRGHKRRPKTQPLPPQRAPNLTQHANSCARTESHRVNGFQRWHEAHRTWQLTGRAREGTRAGGPVCQQDWREADEVSAEQSHRSHRQSGEVSGLCLRMMLFKNSSLTETLHFS